MPHLRKSLYTVAYGRGWMFDASLGWLTWLKRG